jgi:ArsR family transcriptional regulator, arsenate/arsenite/antimonite-responsive transcriptional repressor
VVRYSRTFGPAVESAAPHPDGMDTSTVVEATLVELADGFGALADPTRLRILGQLGDGPHCVCDLNTAVPIAPNVLSYHLRVLREAGLVAATRRGRWIDYALVPEALQRLWAGMPAAPSQHDS